MPPAGHDPGASGPRRPARRRAPRAGGRPVALRAPRGRARGDLRDPDALAQPRDRILRPVLARPRGLLRDRRLHRRAARRELGEPVRPEPRGRGRRRRRRRVPDRPPDPAARRDLPGDGDARVRRDHPPDPPELARGHSGPARHPRHPRPRRLRDRPRDAGPPVLRRAGARRDRDRGGLAARGLGLRRGDPGDPRGRGRGRGARRPHHPPQGGDLHAVGRARRAWRARSSPTTRRS